jgi:hypothetical protein
MAAGYLQLLGDRRGKKDVNWLLVSAAAFALGIGFAHSWLGERYILIRLLRRDNIPHLFGSDWFTKRTLRFAWHLTTVAWWGMAGVLIAQASVAEPATTAAASLHAVAITFAVSAVMAAVASRGRHLAWVVFLLIALLTWLAPGIR